MTFFAYSCSGSVDLSGRGILGGMWAVCSISFGFDFFFAEDILDAGWHFVIRTV